MSLSSLLPSPVLATNLPDSWDLNILVVPKVILVLTASGLIFTNPDSNHNWHCYAGLQLPFSFFYSYFSTLPQVVLGIPTDPGTHLLLVSYFKFILFISFRARILKYFWLFLQWTTFCKALFSRNAFSCSQWLDDVSVLWLSTHCCPHLSVNSTVVTGFGQLWCSG